MPLEMSQVITMFNASNLGELLVRLETSSNLSLIMPIRLFVSFQYVDEVDLKKANLKSFISEIIAQLIACKVIVNTQQIRELGVEKVHGDKKEVLLFITE